MGNEVILDKDLMQRKLLVSSLIHCAGFKLLESELKGYVKGVEVEQDNLKNKPCGDLAGINYLNGWRRGLQDLQYMLDGFRQELDELAGER